MGLPLELNASAIFLYFLIALCLPLMGQVPELGNLSIFGPHSGSLQPSFLTKSTPQDAKSKPSAFSKPLEDGLPAQVVVPRSVYSPNLKPRSCTAFATPAIPEGKDFSSCISIPFSLLIIQQSSTTMYS
eukprot:CAMPEP_0115048858 /NCGR_PEP_ID=MMETSP0227-20121206/840_1 /TAXON_ID=89957 /ORGANISM="Polarella glacialis, Strain CCMP 1383" /LENGTH=128 /DNA_ID=CAMNT_0002432405 /DNA_START=85 /DNA_END=471 /DNA_ORIENTATION=-